MQRLKEKKPSGKNLIPILLQQPLHLYTLKGKRKEEREGGKKERKPELVGEVPSECVLLAKTNASSSWELARRSSSPCVNADRKPDCSSLLPDGRQPRLRPLETSKQTRIRLPSLNITNCTEVAGCVAAAALYQLFCVCVCVSVLPLFPFFVSRTNPCRTGFHRTHLF